MLGIGIPELMVLVVLVGMLCVIVIPFYWIFAKAGFSGWLCLTQFVPILNLVMIYYLAFSEWPAHRELRKARLG